MSFGKPTNTNNNLKAYAFRIRVKDLPSPEFEVKQRVKEGNKFELLKTDEPVTNVRGNLIGLEVKSFNYEGEDIRSANLILQDNEEIDFVTVPTNFVGRSIMNSLLNLQTFENVSISLYNSKPKEEGGKVYAQASVRQNDEIVKWKYAPSDLPAPKTIEFKGKKISDYTETDTKLLNEISELAEKVKNSSSAFAAIKKSAPAPEAHVEVAGKSDEDVPF